MTNQAPTSRVAQLEAALAEISRPMDIAAIMAKPEPTAQEILEWRRHEIEIGNFGEGSAYDKVFTLAAVAVIKLQEARTHAAGLQAQLEGADILIGGTAKLAADLRAQVATLQQEQARLTKERDNAKDVLDTSVRQTSIAHLQIQMLTRERDEAQRDVEKLRDWRSKVTVAFGHEGGTFYEDVPKHIQALTRQLAEAQQECQTAEAACADLMDVADAAERQIAAVRDFCTADSGWAWEDETCLRVLALLDAPTLLPASPPEPARAEEPEPVCKWCNGTKWREYNRAIGLTREPCDVCAEPVPASPPEPALTGQRCDEHPAALTLSLCAECQVNEDAAFEARYNFHVDRAVAAERYIEAVRARCEGIVADLTLKYEQHLVARWVLALLPASPTPTKEPDNGR